MTDLTPVTEALADAIQSTSGCLRFAAESEAADLVEALAQGEHPAHIAFDVAPPRQVPAVTEVHARHEAVVLAASYFRGPWTYDDLIGLYPHRAAVHGFPTQTPPSLRTRCSELRGMGWIEAAGKGRSDVGRPCQTWQLTSKARTWVEAQAVALGVAS